MYAIVVGQRGQVRDGLTALLYSMPEVEVVSTTENYASAEQMIERHGTVLAVLHVDSSDQQSLDWVRRVKARSSLSKILALVSEACLMPEYVAAGVDDIMVEGTSPERLHDAVSTLLRSP